MGLLLSHNCTVEIGPDMIRFHVEGKPPEGSTGQRGEVTTFSRASRKRLFDLLHAFIFDSVTFVTLTYPGEYTSDGRKVKKNLRAWRARLERKYGKIHAIWRLEYQKRGAPHYHILLFDAPWIDRTWLSESWYSIVGSGDVRHLQAGTNVRGPIMTKDRGAIVSYVAKYAGKVDQSEGLTTYQHAGRVWGEWNGDRDETITITLEKSEAIVLAGIALSDLQIDRGYEPRYLLSCTLYGHSLGSDGFRSRILGALQAIRAGRRGGRNNPKFAIVTG